MRVSSSHNLHKSAPHGFVFRVFGAPRALSERRIPSLIFRAVANDLDAVCSETRGHAFYCFLEFLRLAEESLMQRSTDSCTAFDGSSESRHLSSDLDINFCFFNVPR